MCHMEESFRSVGVQMKEQVQADVYEKYRPVYELNVGRWIPPSPEVLIDFRYIDHVGNIWHSYDNIELTH